MTQASRLARVKKILTSNLSTLGGKKTTYKTKTSKKKSLFPKTFIAMDLGSRYIKFAVGKENGERLVVDKLFKLEAPRNTVSDGEISDKIRLTTMIQNALLNAGIKAKDVNITGNSTLIINREIVVPKAEESELGTLIQYEIQQYLPINMNDYIVQYDVLEELQSENVDKLKVLVVTYPKRMAKQYYDLALNSKLKPNALDVNYNAIKKLMNKNILFNGEKNKKEDTIAVVDMGADTTDVTIYKNNVPDFTRIVKFGGNALDQEISKSYNIDLKEAEQRKITKANLENIYPMEEDILLNDLVKQFSQDLLEELQRIFQFYRNKNVGNNINKVYIYGGTSRISGLAKYMENALTVPIKKISYLENITYSKTCNTEEIDLYLNTLGTIIRL
ncbi:type IV pilus assembly protein PilM [Clostridium amylolyticum]|uniref:Type IV pilus assembly protein PilM n=1 Tax=Clostridium amylolyticum TaxID=1121298 RepID=A0A1M6I8C1_9CLOT|nr:type IV pilus assembly protein PilM [Clostridium amylolyticum]SHJ30603.1 type IV pilus assembly protein PilM [Clostridium amylolyticum]